MNVYFVRWKPGTLAQYQYFEPVKAAWVDCERRMVMAFCKRGVVHWNPRIDPTRLAV